jgi:hypothetical protein
MDGDLNTFLDSLKANSRLSSYTEDQVKMAVVLPILKRLGWNTENIDEVFPEFSVGGGRVDYALQLSGKSRVFIEAKRPSEDLDSPSHQEQLLTYSFKHGIEIAVLTNGITWSFFLPRAGGEWKSRKFYTIDVMEQESTDAAMKFIDLLSRSAVASGGAMTNAESLHKGKLKKQAIQDTLPEAWNRIIEEPDSLLVELVAERTERICSFKPELSDVTRFLKGYANQFLLLPLDDSEHPVPHPQPRLPSPSSVNEPPDNRKIPRKVLLAEMIKLLQNHGGQATKEQIETELYNMHRSTFEHPWYQETVSSGIPRWQHNIAWTKEVGKSRGLIKRPTESGRGIWMLTDKGKKFS